jgi:hypothetical protein
MGCGTGVDDVERRKSLSLPILELRPFAARSLDSRYIVFCISAPVIIIIMYPFVPYVPSVSFFVKSSPYNFYGMHSVMHYTKHI